MPKDHVVVQGECLSSIAADEGFANFRTIYDDPANAEFRKLRPNPNLIFPGDVVVIPDRVALRGKVTAGKAQSFVLSVRNAALRLKIENPAPLNFRLAVGAEVSAGSVPGDRIIEMPIPANADSGTLEIWPANFATPDAAGNQLVTNQLQIGHLDPPETTTGVQARLRNLGYESGAIDGIIGPFTKAAIAQFQKDHRLTVDGICGPKTRKALVDAYGL